MTPPTGAVTAPSSAFSAWLEQRLEVWLPTGAGADPDRAVSVTLLVDLEDDGVGELNEELEPATWREYWSGSILGQSIMRPDRAARHLSWDHALQEQTSVVVTTLDAGSSRADGAWAAWLDHWLATEAPHDEEGGAWNLTRAVVSGPLLDALARMRAGIVAHAAIALPWYLSMESPEPSVDRRWHRALNNPATLDAFAQEFNDVAASR